MSLSGGDATAFIRVDVLDILDYFELVARNTCVGPTGCIYRKADNGSHVALETSHIG